MTAPLQYLEGTPEEWDAGVAALQPAAQGGVALVGPCPRCADAIRAPLDDLPLPAFGLHKHKQMVVRVVCNCSTAHPGAPAGVRGCGAEGGVTLQL